MAIVKRLDRAISYSTLVCASLHTDASTASCLHIPNNCATIVSVDQVKVNAVIPDDTRETIRAMSISYGVTVQRIVGALISYGIKNMTTKEVQSHLTKLAKNSPTKGYRRTKPF